MSEGGAHHSQNPENTPLTLTHTHTHIHRQGPAPHNFPSQTENHDPIKFCSSCIVRHFFSGLVWLLLLLWIQTIRKQHLVL